MKRILAVSAALLLSLAGAAFSLFAQSYEPRDFHSCEAAPVRSTAGTVERVREVAVVRDLHAFDPDVLEHHVSPETAEELVIRLDGGPLMTFTHKDRQHLQPGQRVRVILTGTSARVEPDLHQCFA